MRALGLALLLLCPVAGTCQVGWWPAFSRAAQSRPKRAELQLPAKNPAIGKTFKLIHADTGGLRGDEIVAKGNVRATYEGYEIYTDELQGNRKTQVFRLTGNARATMSMPIMLPAKRAAKPSLKFR